MSRSVGYASSRSPKAKSWSSGPITAWILSASRVTLLVSYSGDFEQVERCKSTTGDFPVLQMHKDI